MKNKEYHVKNATLVLPSSVGHVQPIDQLSDKKLSRHFRGLNVRYRYLESKARRLNISATTHSISNDEKQNLEFHAVLDETKKTEI